MALQLRRGTNQQRLGLTPVEGEMIYVTDNILATISVTGINIGTDTLSTSIEHGLIINQQVKYTGATLNGLTKDQVYYVKTAPTTTSFTLSTSLGGGTLDITGTYTVPLVFAKTPCNATGAPLGYDVSPLWAGDGTTVGGNPAGSILLDELRDVIITQPPVEGEFLWYNGTSWINTNETTVDTKAKTLSLTRRSTTAVEEYESGPALRLNSRITDATNDNTDDAGPALRFERSSGTQYEKTYVSGGAIGAFTVTLNNVTNLVVGNKVTGTGLPSGNGALITIIAGNQLTLDTAFTAQAAGTYTIGEPVGFGQLAFEYYGTTDVHKFKVSTSTDNYLEDPPGSGLYPNSPTLISSTKNATSINQDKLYVDAVNSRVGVNTGSPTTTLDVNGSATITGDLAVNGATSADITTTTATATVFNANATTVNAFGDATAITIGVDGAVAGVGTTTIRSATTVVKGDLAVNGDNTGSSADITTTKTTASLFNANATTVNIGNGANTEVNIGSPTGGSRVQIKPNIIVGADTTQNVFNTVATTVNAFGASTATAIGSTASGTTTVGYNLVVGNDLTITGTNINTGLVSGGTDANIINIDATTSSTNIPRNALTLRTTSTGTPTVGFGTGLNFVAQTSDSNFENAGFIAVAATDVTATSEDFRMRFGLMAAGNTYTTVMDLDSLGNLQIDGDLEVTGGNIDRSTTGQGNLFNTNATDVNIGNGASTSVRIGRNDATATVLIKPGIILGERTTQNVFNTVATTVNAFGAASTALNMGHVSGLTTIAGALTTNITLQTPSSDSVTTGNINIGSAITTFPTTGVNTCTLPDGNNGQFKTLVRTGASNSMTVTVTTAGWKFGAGGTISFGDQGDSCFLQFISGWGWTVLGAGQGGQQPVFS